ncbi:Cyclophilin-like domain containing protein [Elaphomyces granulatus]
MRLSKSFGGLKSNAQKAPYDSLKVTVKHVHARVLSLCRVTLVTTVGPLHISLFAKQTPLACKTFVQHCLDGYYVGSPFHRVVRGFILQGGDPSGSGFGGSSIYEDPEFEYGQDPSEKVVFADELHSRLRYNRPNAHCLGGDGIYNVVKIAEAELIEGTDRPIYPVRITGCEVGELGPFQGKLKKRDKIAVPSGEESAIAIKKKKKVKGGKTLLSFGTDDIGGEPKKQQETRTETRSEQRARKRPRSKSPLQTSQNHIHRPKTPDPYTQLPLPDPEAPHRSPSPSPSSPLKALDRTNAEIASLKASMRWNIAPVALNISKKKLALGAMISATSICGRKRHPLDNNTTTDAGGDKTEKVSSWSSGQARVNNGDSRDVEEEDEEAQLCDLHFIANCQSCKPWDNPEPEVLGEAYEDISSSDWGSITGESCSPSTTIGL